MPDRIEREIEEILARLDQEEPSPASSSGRNPVSIVSARKKKEAPPRSARAVRPARRNVTPASLLFAGAGTVVGGLVAASFWSPLIWASFAGVVMFIAAFVWSFVRSPRTVEDGPRGHYWRDRYIEYETPRGKGPIDRLTRRFRRR